MGNVAVRSRYAVAALLVVSLLLTQCKSDRVVFVGGSDVPTQDGGQGGGGTPPAAYGSPVGSYKGDTAYSNGPTHATYPNAYGTFDDYGTYGHQFQCVEYINRFYMRTLGHKGVTCGTGNMRGCGNAVDYYANYRALGLTRFANNGNVSPKPDDILVFSGGTEGTGHVAIITQVDTDGVYVIQQNWDNNTNDGSKFLPMSTSAGIYTIQPLQGVSTSYTPLGWLRLP